MKKTSRVVLTAILVVAMVASLAVTALAGFDFKLKSSYTIEDVVITSDKGTEVKLSDEVCNWTIAKAKPYALITAQTLYENDQDYDATYDDGCSGNIYFEVKGPAVFLYPQKVGSIVRGVEAKYCIVAIDVENGTEVEWELTNGSKSALSGTAIVKNGHADVTLTAAQTAGLPAGGDYSLILSMKTEDGYFTSTNNDINVEYNPNELNNNNNDNNNEPAEKPNPPQKEEDPTQEPSKKWHHTLKVDCTEIGNIIADSDGEYIGGAITAPDEHAAIGYNYNMKTDRHTIGFSVLGGTINISFGDHKWDPVKVSVTSGNNVVASEPSEYDGVTATAAGVSFIHHFFELF